MPSLAVFYQECAVCGRSLRIPVQYFGRKVHCGHCGGEFQAQQLQPSAERQDGMRHDGVTGLFRVGGPLEARNLSAAPAES
jgi:hypothetical protein